MKYAPPNKQGDKPYVVNWSIWGRQYERVIYAKDVAQAKYRAIGRGGVGVYMRGARRATPEDIT